MKNAYEKVVIACSFTGVACLITAIEWSTNRKAFDNFMGELHGMFLMAWVGILILFFTGLTLAVATWAVRLNQERKVIRPSKHGPAQVLIHRGEVILLNQPVEQLDPAKQMAMVKQVMQLSSIMAKSAKQLEIAPAEDTMMIDAPQTVRAEDLRIPTFTESMQSGLIGPGQNEMLICFELERDEETGDLTGEMRPYQDKLENNCTMFLGGASKSGKSTLMAHLAGQSAMMNALFYVIDPHLSHPERSITAKIQSLSHAFVLPPASSDADVQRVLKHAQAEAEARVQGRETPYSGRPIVFIVDEVLNLFGRAQRKPEDKNIQKLYIDLALFLRDLGTQFNKYGMNGIIASQYVTKDAFKLPSGNVDFRDGCQNQTLLRLPANQAQAMRLLQRDELRGVRRLPPGHGYMGFSTGEVIRMAAGNVTVRDIEMAGQIVAAVPNSKQYSLGTVPVPTGTRMNSGVPRIVDTDPTTPVPERGYERITGELKSGATALENRVEQGTARRMKEFTPEQELEFVQKFEQYQSIKRTLSEMGVSYGDYQACASRLVEQKRLRRS